MPPMLPQTPPSTAVAAAAEWQTSVPSDSKWQCGSAGSSPGRPLAAASAAQATWDGGAGGTDNEAADPRRDITAWDGGANHHGEGNPGTHF